VALLATTTVRNLITEPLTNLADISGIGTRQKDYTVRATPLQTDDELAFLVRSFNEMLEQIQQREKALEDSRAELEHRVEERTSELLSANKELEAFSYSVAHDLRGPLQHISNIGYLLQQTAAAKGEQGAALIGMLFEGSRRMSQLIDDLLNLSRATSTPVHRTPIDLSSMARTIVDRLRTDEPQRQVEIVIAQGAHMIADEGLMMVVMENLLRNAWKYTSHSERARIEFGFNDRDAETVYFVRDNGVGFNPRYADRLFRPFQRLHSQEDFPGTGVGLATVARIIERHSGRIWAESEVGHGATFFFTVPYESRD
jgi:light-regulated signal transduction histidine kinase (bacteriophytochrome)